MTLTTTALPAGTWTLDPVHSQAGFAVRHSGIATFRGAFAEVDATLDDGVLSGRVPVASVDVSPDTFKAHLLSPDFFDAERHPDIAFTASDVAVTEERATVRGELTIKGVTRALEATGTVSGPAVYLDGNDRIAVALETVVNRHDFGVSWNADLPGGGKAVGDDVTISVDLQLVKA